MIRPQTPSGRTCLIHRLFRYAAQNDQQNYDAAGFPAVGNERMLPD